MLLFFYSRPFYLNLLETLLCWFILFETLLLSFCSRRFCLDFILRRFCQVFVQDASILFYSRRFYQVYRDASVQKMLLSSLLGDSFVLIHFRTLMSWFHSEMFLSSFVWDASILFTETLLSRRCFYLGFLETLLSWFHETLLSWFIMMLLTWRYFYFVQDISVKFFFLLPFLSFSFFFLFLLYWGAGVHLIPCGINRIYFLYIFSTFIDFFFFLLSSAFYCAFYYSSVTDSCLLYLSSSIRVAPSLT